MLKDTGPNEPAYLSLVQRLAAREGISVEEFFRRSRARAANPDFPTGDCLTVDEVARCIQAGLTVHRHKIQGPRSVAENISLEEMLMIVRHISKCEHCRALIAVMSPST